MHDLHSSVGNADLFPILKSWDFYNHAGVSPLPRPAAHALIDFAQDIQNHAYLTQTWHPRIDETRALAAKMMGAEKQEIAFIKNTSEGLSIVANSIDWNPGDRIVTTNVEYPANIYPWMNAAARFGAELIQVAEETDASGVRSVPLEKILAAAKHERTRLVALSHVEFASGQRHDLKTIGSYCRNHGIFLSIDAIQSLGAVPVDVNEMCIDYLSADGHKWLLSPEAAGVFYCRKELLAKTRPLTIGWLNVVNAMNFNAYDFTLRPDSGRFECGSLNVPGLLAMRESIKLLDGLGATTVANRLKLLGDRLIAGATSKGYTIASPRDGDQWSGILSFSAPNVAPEPLVAKLRKEHRIEIMVRHGRLRAAPHFYNTEAQIDRLIDLLPAN
jgi:selenocysteine lyase/cysteine desulfurase